jgi:hypothetical protein
MSTIADMLAPAARQRLAALGSPPPNEDLAASARAAAADSDGSGRVAWVLVALALDRAASVTEARDVLGEMVEDTALRTTAKACLTALCGNGGTTAETT